MIFNPLETFMIFNPLNDNVIAQPEKAEDKTKSGILLGNPSAREKQRIAIVVAIGDKVTRVKVGDRILFQAFATNDLSVGNDEYISLKEEFIVATVEATK
jgi:chaperonin GroES